MTNEPQGFVFVEFYIAKTWVHEHHNVIVKNNTKSCGFDHYHGKTGSGYYGGVDRVFPHHRIDENNGAHVCFLDGQKRRTVEVANIEFHVVDSLLSPVPVKLEVVYIDQYRMCPWCSKTHDIACVEQAFNFRDFESFEDVCKFSEEVKSRKKRPLVYRLCDHCRKNIKNVCKPEKCHNRKYGRTDLTDVWSFLEYKEGYYEKLAKHWKDERPWEESKFYDWLKTKYACHGMLVRGDADAVKKSVKRHKRKIKMIEKKEQDFFAMLYGAACITQ